MKVRHALIIITFYPGNMKSKRESIITYDHDEVLNASEFFARSKKFVQELKVAAAAR